MKNVKITGIYENRNPRFVKTKLVSAERDGKCFSWEIIEAHDSVHVLVDNTETKELLFVSQVRVPVLINNSDSFGITIEACAGLVDKNKSLVEIAQEEVFEEVGYSIDTDDFVFIRDLRSNVGQSGSKSSCFYVPVTEADRVNDGGGLDDEDIEVVRVPYEELETFLFNAPNIDAMTMFLSYFWMNNIKS
jgi:UDP-sugar diphosphatase